MTAHTYATIISLFLVLQNLNLDCKDSFLHLYNMAVYLVIQAKVINTYCPGTDLVSIDHFFYLGFFKLEEQAAHELLSK